MIIVSSGTTYVVSSGQPTDGIDVQQGGTLIVSSGTVTNVDDSGLEVVYSQGVVSSTTVENGASLVLEGSGGQVVNATFVADSFLEVGRDALVLSNGLTFSTDVTLDVDYGGTVVIPSGVQGPGSATVESGGTLELLSGAQAPGATTVSSGGVLEVFTGAEPAATIVNAGGMIELVGGAQLTSAVTIDQGGIIELAPAPR